MSRSRGIVVGLTVVAAVVAPCRPAAAADSPPPDPQITVIDPAAFFQGLVERYRRLAVYRDQVHLTQTIAKADAAPHRVETELICNIDDEGDLQVRSPAAQAAEAMGLGLPLRSSAGWRQLRLRYHLWLLPHLTLKFAQKPLEEFREGVDGGFRATEAAAVTEQGRSMVQVKLRSGQGSEEPQAAFDLYVNPQSMLIERIEGAQELPDGTSLQTTLDITPVYESSVEPEPTSAPAPADPTVAPSPADPALPPPQTPPHPRPQPTEPGRPPLR